MGQKYFIVFLLFAFFVLFFLEGFFSLDPDFGWHLRTGQIILEKGIPKTDPFSYTMPSYNFIDHEWLFDILIARIYLMVNLYGLAVIFSIISVFSIVLQIFPISKFKKWDLIPLFLSFSVFLSFVAVRPQIISWLFFSILIKIIMTEKFWRKRNFLLPFLFLFWANLHGGFMVGIGVLVVAIIFKISKKNFISSFFLILLCIITTLINPYGFGLWREVLKSVFDTSLRWSIIEWSPSILFLNLALWIYLVLSVVLVLKFRRKVNRIDLVLFFGLLIAGLSSIRNIPFWVIVSLPVTTKTLHLFESEVSLYRDGKLRLEKVFKAFLLFILVLVLGQEIYGLFSEKLLNEESYYPKKAVEYLKDHTSKGQILSDYGWGGYLIWKLPNKKVFIDGRMPSWRQENINSRESAYAFGEYRDLMSGKISLKEEIKKYNIDTILLRNNEDLKKDNILKWLSSFWGFNKRNLSLESQIKNRGFREIYKDSEAVIYGKIIEKEHIYR